jgi:hypothetical protein
VGNVTTEDDRAQREAPVRRHHRRRWFFACGVALVLVVGAVSGFRAWLTQEPSQVSVGDAVNRYRAGSGPPPSEVTSGPQPGVYVYTTSGSESVDALGGDTHTYPDPTIMTVTPSACGFTMSWTPVAERVDVTRLCRTGGGVVEASTTNSHTFFHMTQAEEFACDPGAWWLPPPAVTAWTATCRSPGTTTIRTARVIGTEPLTVGPTTVEAVHIRFDDAISGTSIGTSNTDWWFDPGTGLPLRQHATTQTSSETQIGHVSFHETIDLALTSLKPQT